MAVGALSLPSELEPLPAVPGAYVPEDLAGGSEAALHHLGVAPMWLSQAAAGVPEKRLRLFRSTRLLAKGGRLYDLLDPWAPPLRPPFDNRYLHTHRLPAERSDVAGLDLDGDGFTNIEEYEGGETDPRDRDSHPPFTDKLCLVGIREEAFSLTFTGGDDRAGVAVRERRRKVGEEREAVANNLDLSLGGRFGRVYPGRWQAIAYEKRGVLNPRTGAMRDVSVLTVRDGHNPASPPLELTLGEERPMPTYLAVLRFDLPGHEGVLQVTPKVGGTFELPPEPGVVYELTGLSGRLEDGAEIRRVGSGGDSLAIGPCGESG